MLSTHIVEDIAQTCQRMAVMKQGSVIFQGSIASLVRETQGKVWPVITTQGTKLAGDLTIVSTLNMGDTMQYRVVGELKQQHGIVATEPNLEDAYVWLMREQRLPA
ncbi:MAG TPA: hypothetical protein VGN34_03165 [Ktedonobacteraceae bacterium]|jgi:ABC-type multidrug transport system ATPase subunit